jgi:O-antigen/teichoic acid export membrane protein
MPHFYLVPFLMALAVSKVVLSLVGYALIATGKTKDFALSFFVGCILSLTLPAIGAILYGLIGICIGSLASVAITILIRWHRLSKPPLSFAEPRDQPGVP